MTHILHRASVWPCSTANRCLKNSAADHRRRNEVELLPPVLHLSLHLRNGRVDL